MRGFVIGGSMVISATFKYNRSLISAILQFFNKIELKEEVYRDG